MPCSLSLHTWTHQNTGIVVMMMLIASCVCCVGFVGLCCGEFPLIARVIGAVCLAVTAVAAFLYTGKNPFHQLPWSAKTIRNVAANQS